MMETLRTGWLLRGLRRGTRQSHGERRRLQGRLLRTAVAHAYAHVPFYRRVWDAAGVDPRSVRSIDDLERLPIISTTALRAAAISGELLSVHASTGPHFSTNGTSGNALHVPRGATETRLWRAAGLRMLFEHGFAWQHTTVQFDRAPAPPHPLQRLGIGRTIWLCPALPLEEQLVRLAAAAADFVFAAPTMLRRVCRALSSSGLRVQAPRAVFSHSELLDAETRETICRLFGTQPIDVYGMTEVGYIAWQCPRRADLHVNADVVAVEVRGDHGAVAPGQLGQVVVTDLRGRTMPLLRCATGDIARTSTAACGCGLTLPTIAAIEGRWQQAIELPDGAIVTPRAIIDALSGTLRLDEYRLHQDAPRRFLLTMTRDAYLSGGDEAQLRRRLRARLGDVELEIRIAPVQRIGSKTRAVSRGTIPSTSPLAAHALESDHAVVDP